MSFLFMSVRTPIDNMRMQKVSMDHGRRRDHVQEHDVAYRPGVECKYVRRGSPPDAKRGKSSEGDTLGTVPTGFPHMLFRQELEGFSREVLHRNNHISGPPPSSSPSPRPGYAAPAQLSLREENFAIRGHPTVST